MAFASTVLESWNDIHRHAKHGWLFRGHSSADYELSTSLERCCDGNGVAPDERVNVERELFREFRRAYHQYASHVPEPDAVLEWLSLMQHHGAPTRFLDCTYSVYIAAYFALEEAEGDCAVWAIDGPWALRQSVAVLEGAGKRELEVLVEPLVEENERVVEPLFFEEPYVRVACPLNPFRLNERLRLQKGAFLIPGDISASFIENLEALDGHDDPAHVVRIVLPLALRREALRHLFQMNISRTSLFPGLDGYAQSLGIYHPVFDPVDWI